MRVLLVNNLFQPEPNHLKGLAFAKELRRRGHEVHVLTGFPNYPGGKVYPGYRIRWTMDEELDGVPVKRVAMYPSHDGSTLRRVGSYLSLGASQALHALFAERFDVCHVYLGPLPLFWPAAALRARRGTRIVADVQDLWPESVTDSGMLRSGAARTVLDAWCKRAYRSADRLIVLSDGYKRALVERGVAPDRIDVVHNWCDERVADDAPVPEGALRPGAFNVVYAGNLGRLQGIDTIVDAAKRVAPAAPAVRITLVGGGVEAERIARRISDERIDNVRLIGRVPPAEANAIQRRAELLLVHVLATPLTRVGIPQKVQAYLAAGRPILLAAEGDARALLERAGAGLACAPSDPEAMASAILRAVAMEPAERARLGASGAEFYARELSFQRGVGRIEQIFQRTVNGG